MSRNARRAAASAGSSYVGSDFSRGRTRHAVRMLAAAAFFVAVAALDVVAVAVSTRSQTSGRSTVWLVLGVSSVASAALWTALLRRWWTRRSEGSQPSRRRPWVGAAASFGAGAGVLLAHLLSATGGAVLAGLVVGLALVSAVCFAVLAYRIAADKPFAPVRPRSRS